MNTTKCFRCGGKGIESATSNDTCPVCFGTGYVCLFTDTQAKNLESQIIDAKLTEQSYSNPAIPINVPTYRGQYVSVKDELPKKLGYYDVLVNNKEIFEGVYFLRARFTSHAITHWCKKNPLPPLSTGEILYSKYSIT